MGLDDDVVAFTRVLCGLILDFLQDSWPENDPAAHSRCSIPHPCVVHAPLVLSVLCQSPWAPPKRQRLVQKLALEVICTPGMKICWSEVWIKQTGNHWCVLLLSPARTVSYPSWRLEQSQHLAQQADPMELRDLLIKTIQRSIRQSRLVQTTLSSWGTKL